VRTFVSLAFLIAVLGWHSAPAQGVAPCGPIGNSTGIGSGIGPGTGPGSTAPSFPNATRDPTPPPAIPPGGHPPVGRFDSGAGPSTTPPSSGDRSRHLQPRDPFDPSTPRR
jgi:hypothetical protein